MINLERDLDRILTALRNRIRERGFTQLEVQEVLGWGRSYISQLLTKQKTLRIEQILQILNVINVEPEDFWGEIYQFGQFGDAPPSRRRQRALPAAFEPAAESMLEDLRRIGSLVKGVVAVLVRKNLITEHDFDAAVQRFKRANP